MLLAGEVYALLDAFPVLSMAGELTLLLVGEADAEEVLLSDALL